MNRFLLAAAVLTFVVGLVHSVFGEILIFSKLRRGGIIPTEGAPLLRERNVRIVWASWHVVTAFGWAMGWVLASIARQPAIGPSDRIVGQAIAMSMLCGSVLVAVGTKGRHPGWIGLLGVAALVYLGRAV
jgi:hypothetical protein